MTNHAADYWASMREKWGTGDPRRTFGEWSAIYWEEFKCHEIQDEELLMMFRKRTEGACND